MNSQRNALTERIIGCAIAVDRELGPGLLESTYEEALCIELSDAALSYRRQASIPAVYYRLNGTAGERIHFRLQLSR